MGTRADFYVGRGPEAEWLGSIAFDGYPGGITPHLEETEMSFGGRRRHKNGEWPEGAHLFDASTEAEYRERVMHFFRFRTDVTLPADGWPWPWEDSGTTDYAYAFDAGTVWGTCFGNGWWPANAEPEENPEGQDIRDFPNMEERKNVTWGDRSGLLVIGFQTPETA